MANYIQEIVQLNEEVIKRQREEPALDSVEGTAGRSIFPEKFQDQEWHNNGRCNSPATVYYTHIAPPG